MVRVESVAGVSPSISVLSSKSVLRRDLRQQCSRVALMSAIGLAAAASASLMSPGQALADCAVGATTVACTTTVTTNTTYPNGAPNDRAYQVVSPSVLTGTVSTGSTVSGHGLSLTNNGTGGLDFVNNGTIRGDAADFVSGQASLSLASSAGDLRYSGSGDVIGDEDAVSDGIVAIQTGAGVIDLDIGGTVRGIEGVTAIGTGTGAVNVAVRGSVSAIFDAGVHATGTKAVTVTVDGSVDGYYDGVAVATTSNTQDDVTVRGTGTIHAYGGAAISVANQGNGRSVIDFDGAVTDTVGDGISVRDRVGSGDIAIDVRSVAAGTGGILVHQDGYGSTSINVDEDVRGGYVGVSVTSVPGQAGAVDINIGGAVTAEAGIEVVRFSSTNLTPINITVGGPITATAGDGVNLSSRGDMNVNVGDITAAGDGIDIRAGNNGAAHISITGAGDIVAQGGRGITILNEYAQTVDINRPGSITGTDGDGIHIRNTTALAGDVNVLVGAVNATGVDVDGGAADGIDISYSSDVANLNLTVNGDVEADGRGVYAALTSAAAAGDIDITTNGAVRGSYGIDAINNGTGGVAITAAGPVTGTIYDGIYAQTSGGAISIAVGDATGQTGAGVTAQILNAPTSTNAITITADNLTGRTGVTASNSGLGGVSITTTGDVTGIIGDAVVVGSAGDVDVNIAGTVTGGQRGIAVQAAGDISVQTAAITTLNGNGVDIENQGAGDVDFVSTGPINATNGNGVVVTDTAIGGDISVTTGDVTALGGGANSNAIRIRSQSVAGDITVVADGDLRADYRGVDAQLQTGSTGDINVTVRGSIDAEAGIYAYTAGTGNVSVAASGPITTTFSEGIYASANGGAISITAGDVSSVNDDGIEAYQSEWATTAAVTITAGAVTGETGIRVANAGTGVVSVTANGPVTGTLGNGIEIEADGAVSVVVADTVTGAEDGVTIRTDSGDVSVTGTGGFVAQDGYGLAIENNGSGRVDVDISGAVVATNGNGVEVYSSALDGGDIGVRTGSVTALSDGYDGISVLSRAANGSDVTVVANGDVLAEENGIFVGLTDAASTGDIDVTSNGRVAAEYGMNLFTKGSGSITVNAVGPVEAIQEGIFAGTTGGDIAITAGAVTSQDSAAIYALQDEPTGAGDIDIVTNGPVSGTIGIQVVNGGTGAIRIAANGAVTGTDGAGIQVGGDAVAITVAGRVQGTDTGLYLDGGNGGDGDISVTGSGGFAGRDGPGVGIVNRGSGTVTFDVSGDISSETSEGLLVVDTIDGGDISVTTGTVTTLDSQSDAIRVDSLSTTANVSITANGNLRGGDYGVYAAIDQVGTGDISVVTRGTIEALKGIVAFNTGAGAVNVDATGPVTTTGIGVNAVSRGGDVTVAVGQVTSANVVGVSARQENAAGAGDISVTAGTVTGTRGIEAVNLGTGAVSVTTTGAITGTTDEGIVATGRGAVNVDVGGTVTGATDGAYIEGGDSGAGDISVTGTGGFNGQNGYGVRIQNEGSGRVTYDVSGAVTSNGYAGVGVRDTGSSSGISVTTGDVTSTGSNSVAIDVYSQSATADTDVTANGNLRAGLVGISVQHYSMATGDIAVVSRGTIDAVAGIYANNQGSGSVSVESTGQITGSDFGVMAQSQGGDVTVAVGQVTASNGPAVVGQQINAAGTGDVSVTTGAVSGSRGIEAVNAGSGTVSVTTTSSNTTTGIVNGTTAEGILALGRSAVSVSFANTVTGATRGATIEGGAGGTGDISVAGNGGFVGQSDDAALISNLGSGTVTVDIAGASGSAFGSGIVVRDTANGGDISVTTGSVIATTTDENAIDIRSQSETADITVVANGALTAGTNGVLAYLGDVAATGDINVRTNAAVTGAVGINAQNLGLGDTGVTATGAVTASVTGIVAYARAGAVTVNANDVSSTGNFGVFAQAGSTSTSDVTVTAGSVSGLTGVYASNDGTGAVSVTTTGLVTATGSNGIQAMSNGGDVTVNAANVAGPAGVGIVAVQQNAAGAGDVTVTAANVAGGTGVLASNAGSGDTRITTTGNVTGTSNGTYGIQSFRSGSGDAFIDANKVSGENAGIRADNLGTGVTDITVRGTVQGGSVGVSVYSDGDQDVRIANAGVIRSTAGLSSDRAIEASGGFIDFTNTGTLVGDINFQGDTSAFDNQGAWNTAGGDSTFAGVDDELVNAATGSILAMSTAGAQDLTLWRGLETFQNNGRLSLGDNGAGDIIMTSANTVFAAGSVLQLDVAGVNLADLFATTGTLTIEAGARLDVNFVQPLVLNGRYLIARADGGLTGRFDFEDRLLSAFVGLRDVYTATTASIEVGQLRAMMEAGLTPNQRETGAAADSLSDTNPLKTALLLLPNDAAAQDAFDQLSGEIHPAARRAMADDSRQFRDAVLDRLSDDRADGTVWGRVLVEERNTDADGNAAKVEHDARGLIFGADRALTDSLTVGVAGGWFNTNLDILHRDSSGSTQSQQALAYLGARLDRWGLRAGVGYAATSTDTQREIAFPGFSASPTADYDGSVLQGFVEAGYRLPMHGGYVEPFANLTMITAETDAFHEAGGPAALAVEARDESLTATTLGFRFQTDRSSAFSLRGTAGWRNLSGDLEPAGRHAFDGGTPFTVLGAAHSDTAAVGNLEALWRLSPNVTLSTAWDGLFGNKGEDHTISGRFKIAF